MEWLKKTLGGCYWASYINRHKMLYTWEMSGKLVKEILPQIYPYLIIKEEQANIASKFLLTVNASNRRLSKQIITERNILKENLTSCHH